MKRYIVASKSKKPRWWNSQFATKVCKAYDEGILENTRESAKKWFTQYNDSMPAKESDIQDVLDIIDYYNRSINSASCIKSSSDESVFDDCYEEALEGALDFIEEGSAWDYDDVVSEVYAQIQEYFDTIHGKLSDKLEDEIYEAVMEALDDKGYIDHRNGLLLFESEE